VTERKCSRGGPGAREGLAPQPRAPLAARETPAHHDVLTALLVIDTASETVARFRDEWAIAKEDLPVNANVANAIEAHMGGLALLNDAA
jgi:hypothetical protein